MTHVRDDYDSIFSTLYPLIAYGSSITVNMPQLENEFRELIQQARNDIEGFTSEMNNSQSEASAMLESIRAASAESGVSQHAIHFQKESKSHDKQSKYWKYATIGCASLLAIYSVIAIIGYEWLTSDKIEHIIQLTVGKVLLFAVISYAVFLSARNFMSHTHNTIVNKHRQNALLTFRALADATTDEATRDVILTHASACIFSPQDTGYTKSDGKPPTPDPSVIGLIPKIMNRPQ